MTCFLFLIIYFLACTKSVATWLPLKKIAAKRIIVLRKNRKGLGGCGSFYFDVLVSYHRLQLCLSDSFTIFFRSSQSLWKSCKYPWPQWCKLNSLWLVKYHQKSIVMHWHISEPTLYKKMTINCSKIIVPYPCCRPYPRCLKKSSLIIYMMTWLQTVCYSKANTVSENNTIPS